MILFESLRNKKKCCEMCKGCYYDNKLYDSGTTWLDRNDPCVSLSCRAGVVTRSAVKCHVTCQNPTKVEGQCCPVCRGCTYEGKTYKEGEEFTLKTDSCTTCKCQNGGIICTKVACPLLNCPKNVIYQPKDQCCPTCEGSRRIFNLPGGRCFFQNKIYRNGDRFRPNNCSQCVCTEGTLTCESDTCPPLTCPVESRSLHPGACCYTCPKKAKCEHKGKIYRDSQKWQPNICTSCACDDGATRCHVQQCLNALLCPNVSIGVSVKDVSIGVSVKNVSIGVSVKNVSIGVSVKNGYKLRYVEGECCPRCIEALGVCTVFGDPHYRTFDGKIYNFQGPCKYLLAEDTVGKSFSVRVRNDARTSPWFTWTRMLTVYLGSTKIGLHQKLVVKVDRKRVKLPYRNRAEFSIIKNSKNVILKAAIGLKIIWDGDSFVEVSVSNRFKRKTAGLCGNYNGLGADDMVGRDKRKYFDSEQFGSTWRVGGKAACAIDEQFKHNGTLCTIDPIRKRKARKACSLFLGNVFSKCRRKVDVRQFYRSCIDDMCDCPAKKFCACESFKAYSEVCRHEGVRVNTQRHVFCPSQCPERAIFKPCTRKCPRTCEEPHRTELCRQTCEPGCLCPSRRVLHNNKCILRTECPAR
ncbi:hypothetical protein FSP39_015187 [Pinctada imbricata]|uniref:BMP-binding endothelial regulator protein n=1 Tax=Pinctada imbricata TaxID=66713 RepID=A0AA88XD99_PINIB|nr:hypothetical protein FSP39_015187 [Pinctada imbricata]